MHYTRFFPKYKHFFQYIANYFRLFCNCLTFKDLQKPQFQIFFVIARPATQAAAISTFLTLHALQFTIHEPRFTIHVYPVYHACPERPQGVEGSIIEGAKTKLIIRKIVLDIDTQFVYSTH